MANGFNGSLPAWMKFVSMIGVPSAIAMYLIYFLSFAVMGSLDSHKEEHTREMRALTQMLFHSACRLMDMTFVLPMNLRFLQTSIPQSLTQKLLTQNRL